MQSSEVSKTVERYGSTKTKVSISDQFCGLSAFSLSQLLRLHSFSMQSVRAVLSAPVKKDRTGMKSKAGVAGSAHGLKLISTSRYSVTCLASLASSTSRTNSARNP